MIKNGEWQVECTSKIDIKVLQLVGVGGIIKTVEEVYEWKQKNYLSVL
jgi:hypothetical protein